MPNDAEDEFIWLVENYVKCFNLGSQHEEVRDCNMRSNSAKHKDSKGKVEMDEKDMSFDGLDY